MIPEDWEVKDVGRISSLKNGYSFKSNSYNPLGKYKIITISNVQDGYFYTEECNKIATIPTDLQPHQELTIGDILISMTGNVGRVCIVNEINCLLNQRVGKLIPNSDINSSFFYHLLRTSRFRATLIENAKGGAQGNLNIEDIYSFSFSLSPLVSEQSAIATVLSDTDSLIESLEQLIAKKRLIKQGAMQELLTGKRRLPGFAQKSGYKQTEVGVIPEDWETKNLGDISEIVMGQSPSSLNYNSKGEGLPLIQGMADISDRKTIKRIFTREISKLGKVGDILMSVRAPVGEIAKTMFDVCLGRGVCAIRHPTEFLYHYLISQEQKWKKISKGSTFDSINSDDVKELIIVFPSNSNEREAIATVLSDMDEEITSLEDKLSKLRQIKLGMMQELLTGRIRLV